MNNNLNTFSPDAPKFILGDFNHCRINKTLRTVCKRREWTIKTVKCWSEDCIDNLKACFECTAWDVFYDTCSDLNKLTQTVLSYISFCVDTNIPQKNITVYPNNKPWVTKELKNVINKKKKIFYIGNNQERKDVNKVVKNEIRKAKRADKDKVEHKYSSGDLRAAWRGIKSMSSVTNIQDDNNRAPIRIEGSTEDLPNAHSWFENHKLSVTKFLFRVFPLSLTVIWSSVGNV